MPPFNNQPTNQRFELPKQPTIRKSLDDFANEVFEQLNEKAQPQSTDHPLDNQTEPFKAEEVAEKNLEARKISSNTRQPLDGNRSSTRGSSVRTKTANSNPIKNHEIGNIVPTSRTALVQAIITTEILGPPKAKRR